MGNTASTKHVKRKLNIDYDLIFSQLEPNTYTILRFTPGNKPKRDAGGEKFIHGLFFALVQDELPALQENPLNRSLNDENTSENTNQITNSAENSNFKAGADENLKKIDEETIKKIKNTELKYVHEPTQTNKFCKKIIYEIYELPNHIHNKFISKHRGVFERSKEVARSIKNTIGGGVTDFVSNQSSKLSNKISDSFNSLDDLNNALINVKFSFELRPNSILSFSDCVSAMIKFAQAEDKFYSISDESKSAFIKEYGNGAFNRRIGKTRQYILGSDNKYEKTHHKVPMVQCIDSSSIVSQSVGINEQSDGQSAQLQQLAKESVEYAKQRNVGYMILRSVPGKLKFASSIVSIGGIVTMPLGGVTPIAVGIAAEVGVAFAGVKFDNKRPFQYSYDYENESGILKSSVRTGVFSVHLFFTNGEENPTDFNKKYNATDIPHSKSFVLEKSIFDLNNSDDADGAFNSPLGKFASENLNQAINTMQVLDISRYVPVVNEKKLDKNVIAQAVSMS